MKKSKPKTYNQEDVTMLRMSVIECCQKVLDDKAEVKKWSAYKKELVLKMSARVLPQLNAGREDRESLFPAPLLNGKSNVQSDASSSKTAKNEKENP